VNKFINSVLIFIILIFTTACQPEQAPVPPTPAVVQIQYTVALEGWIPKLTQCANSISDIGLVTEETLADKLDPTKVDLVFRFGPDDLGIANGSSTNTNSNTQAASPTTSPVEFHSFVLGEDTIVLVVNSANDTHTLTPEMVTAIYSGETKTWTMGVSDSTPAEGTESGEQIQVWTYPEGDDLRQVFDRAFLSENHLSSLAYLAPDQNAMIEAISTNPLAIGFLLESQLPAILKVISLQGETSFNLTQPILALSAVEPQGQVRQLLLCLQKD
jgi:hypothetical protein